MNRKGTEQRLTYNPKSSVEGKIPIEVKNLAKKAIPEKGRTIFKEGYMTRHYIIVFDNDDDIRILRQDGNPNLFLAVEHVWVGKEITKNGYSKKGTAKVWIERGDDGEWTVTNKL